MLGGVWGGPDLDKTYGQGIMWQDLHNMKRVLLQEFHFFETLSLHSQVKSYGEECVSSNYTRAIPTRSF